MSDLQLWQEARLEKLDDMVGNTEALAALRAFQTGFLLLSGPIGTGKTSTAIAFVRERAGVQLEEGQTLCKPDSYFVQHVHAVDFQVSTATDWKFWFHHHVQTFLIVDESQELRKSQWSRLKSIAPRKSLTIIFCTSEPETIEPSLVDRCTHVRLKPLSLHELRPMVERACALKGIEYNPAILPALNKGRVFRPRAILNVVESVARGIPVEQAMVGQSGLGA